MEKKEMTLTLTAEEVNAILQVLGEMPTKMGLYPLALKIKEQAESTFQDKAE